MEAPSGDIRVIGIECGGTRTVALAAVIGRRRPLARVEAGAANLRLVSDAALRSHFEDLRARLPGPSAVGVGMAGVRTEEDRRRLRACVAGVWPGVPVRVDHDLVTALEAASLDASGPVDARVIVLSGTGSCCFGRNREGSTAKAGGWGHQLGDQGSGHAIGHAGLREAISHLEHTGRIGTLARRLLAATGVADPEAWVAWMQSATKREIAALAPEVFAAAASGDPRARAVVERCLGELVDLALVCAGRLDPGRRGGIEFVLAGSVFLRQPRWMPHIEGLLRATRPDARVRPLRRESAWGAVVLAAQALAAGDLPDPSMPAVPARPGESRPGPLLARPEPTGPSPTEARNPRSHRLDRMSLPAAIDLMLSEESSVPAAIARHRTALARLIRRVEAALGGGGRLLYVGAGTSGRLGVLDASECPPTFRTPPEWIQGIMAGGEKALHSAVEGAEDDAGAGHAALVGRKVSRRDVVLGIAASGRTPYVWGALAAAREAGAGTALLCFNPNLRFPRGLRPETVLAIDVGPEVLTGSTRLKAGTATKLVLNLLTTLAMVRLGKVEQNLMIDLNPSNLKLRDRAVRIVGELTGLEAGDARKALEASGWRVAAAVKAVRREMVPARRGSRR